MAFRNRLQYGHSDLQKFINDDLATLCVHLNVGPVVLEFKIGKDVHPVISFVKTNISDKVS